MHGLLVKPNILSSDRCNQIIDLFDHDDRSIQGHPYPAKLSTDLHCNFNDTQWHDYNDIILPAVQTLVSCIRSEYYFINYCGPWDISDWYNIQYYQHDQGYYRHHCEHGRNALNRILAWMIYLNVSPCGTEFPYQQTTLQAIQGHGAIWSAHWTHPHRGVTPNIGNKYIATGWCEYAKRSE